MPMTFVSDSSIETYTEAKEREHSRKHEQATYVPITFGWCHDQFNKNTDGEYLEEMKTFKRTDLTPNKQGYREAPNKKQKVGKTTKL